MTTDDGREVVPILPVKRDFFLGTSACTRKHFPLMTSYAFTVHKSQSITVDKMVTDLSERYFQTGLSYVAVSRAKTLDGLMINTPFERASIHYEKLPDGVLMKVRDQDLHKQQQLDRPLFLPLFYDDVAIVHREGKKKVTIMHTPLRGAPAHSQSY